MTAARHAHRLGPLLLVAGAAILAGVMFVLFVKALVWTVKVLAMLVGAAVGVVMVAARRARQARHAV